MAGNPDACLYHVWAFVQLKPGNLSHELTEVCLACGVRRDDNLYRADAVLSVYRTDVSDPLHHCSGVGCENLVLTHSAYCDTCWGKLDSMRRRDDANLRDSS